MDGNIVQKIKPRMHRWTYGVTSGEDGARNKYQKENVDVNLNNEYDNRRNRDSLDML